MWELVFTACVVFLFVSFQQMSRVTDVAFIPEAKSALVAVSFVLETDESFH
jgi:hypothetical protein